MTKELFVVEGLGIGEETKSQTVEWLTWQLLAHTVLRSGGSQAGHHIMTEDGREQMFSHFGAGTFEGARTHLKHMVINPVDLFTEGVELEGNGIENPFDLITIDKDCLTVTPFHGAISRLKEKLRGEDKKGTVGKGVGDAVKDSKLDNADLSIHAGEFLEDTQTLKRKVNAIRIHKLQQAIELVKKTSSRSPEIQKEIEILEDETLVNTTVESFQSLASLVKIVDDTYLDEVLNREGFIVTEPSHGALLHPWYGFVPHVTQIDPTGQDVLTTLKERNYSGKIKRIGVSRAYMTRHGAGPLVSFSRELTDSIQETHNAANEFANEWLGEFRNGYYDTVAMNYAIEISGGRESFDGLSISYLDKLENRPVWEVCEAYMYTGRATDLDDFFVVEDDRIVGIKKHPDTRDEKHYAHQLRLTELLKECEPVVKVLKPTDSENLEEVFLQYVEEKIQLPVVATAHGPRKIDRQARPGWEHLFAPNKSPEEVGLNHRTVIQENLRLPNGVEIQRPLGVELFLAGTSKSSSQEMTASPKLQEQAKERRQLYQNLRKMFDNVTDVTANMHEALEKGLINSADLNQLYGQLANFMSTDEHNGRIILYLPLELLPMMQDSVAEKKFITIYKEAWLRLLYESEPRASFTDGDVLEPGLGEPEHIRKAAHLLPDLLKKGIVEPSEIIDLLEVTSDSELLMSIAEGIKAADRNLFSLSEWQRIGELSFEKSELALLFKTTNLNKTFNDFELLVDIELSADMWIRMMKGVFEENRKKIESLYAPESAYVKNMSQARAVWEKDVKIAEYIDQASDEISKKMHNGLLSSRDIETLIEVQDLDYQDIGIAAIMKTGERLAVSNRESARTFADEYKTRISNIWDTNKASVRNSIMSLLNHWKNLDIITEDYVEAFGIKTPDLSAPFPVNLERLAETDFHYLVEGADMIKNHPQLSQYIYPQFLLFGSRAKGYHAIDADYDAAIFIKPDTPWEKREEVLALLHQEVPNMAWVDKVLEYWMSEKEGVFGFRTNPDLPTVLGPSQSHFFMNGIWIGASEELHKIQTDILKKYTDLSRFGEQKESVRTSLLRRMELDMLQYRLLHKGYNKFSPSQISAEKKKRIDGNSAFWDPGYRRIASLLFVSRVFLPDLS